MPVVGGFPTDASACLLPGCTPCGLGESSNPSPVSPALPGLPASAEAPQAPPLGLFPLLMLFPSDRDGQQSGLPLQPPHLHCSLHMKCLSTQLCSSNPKCPSRSRSNLAFEVESLPLGTPNSVDLLQVSAKPSLPAQSDHPLCPGPAPLYTAMAWDAPTLTCSLLSPKRLRPSQECRPRGSQK